MVCNCLCCSPSVKKQHCTVHLGRISKIGFTAHCTCTEDKMMCLVLTRHLHEGAAQCYVTQIGIWCQYRYNRQKKWCRFFLGRWIVLDYKGDNIRLKYVSEMLDIVEEKGKGKQDAFKEKIRLYVGVSLYIYSKLNRWFMKCKLYRS